VPVIVTISLFEILVILYINPVVVKFNFRKDIR